MNRSHRITLIAAAALGVVALTLWFAVRPDLPTQIDLATATQLVTSGQVDSLYLDKTTLTIHETSGRKTRVEGVSQEAWDQLIALARQEPTVPSFLKTFSLPLPAETVWRGYAGVLVPVTGLLAVVLLLIYTLGRLQRRRPLG